MPTLRQSTRTRRAFESILGLASASLFAASWAQTPVYRCDTLYSNQVCAPDAVALQAPSAPTPEQVKARDQLTQQAQNHAQALAQKRQQDEAAAAQNAQATSLMLERQHAATPAKPAASQSQDLSPVARKKRQKKPSPYFTAKPPATAKP